jgi:hypothetical protein
MGVVDETAHNLAKMAHKFEKRHISVFLQVKIKKRAPKIIKGALFNGENGSAVRCPLQQACHNQ